MGIFYIKAKIDNCQLTQANINEDENGKREKKNQKEQNSMKFQPELKTVLWNVYLVFVYFIFLFDIF